MGRKPTMLAFSIMVLQILTWLNGALFVIFLSLFIYGYIDPYFGLLSLVYYEKFILAVAGLFFAIWTYKTYKGLLELKKWARISSGIIGLVLLYNYPVGTIAGLLLIIGVTKGWPVEVDMKDESKTNHSATGHDVKL